jgi:UDPglucose 6-dehydrogenase
VKAGPAAVLRGGNGGADDHGVVRISVIGLGKLGAPMAAVFAAKGHHVVGVDVNEASVAALAAGLPPVEEPELRGMLAAGRSRLRATRDFEVAAAESDVTFIIVPTPSDREGAFSNEYVVAAVECLGTALQRKDGYHVVAVTSTVMPGSMQGPIRSALERSSNRRVGVDVGLCYNPEFVALGSVVNDMLYPDFLLIGESDPRAGETVASVYRTVCDTKPEIHRMNFVNAEIAKISVNTFVTTKISYANMLADMCDRLPGADAEVVASAVGADSRIGRKYLRGAVGYGGPCFPRDNMAFAVLAKRLGARCDLAEATDALNKYQVDRLYGAVAAHAAPGTKIAVLGMAYKPETSVVEESQGVMLARRLARCGYRVAVHDPGALGAAALKLGGDAEAVSSARAAIAGSRVTVIVTPWTEYARLGAVDLRGTAVVIDCWRILPRDLGDAVKLVWLGHGEYPVSSDASSAAV